MKKHYIEVEMHGRPVQLRVEVNVNSMEDYETISGETVGDFEQMAAKVAAAGKSLKISVLKNWAWATIKEGERLDGRTFKLSPAEVGALLGASALREFVATFIYQYTGTVTGVAHTTIKKKLWKMALCWKKNPS